MISIFVCICQRNEPEGRIEPVTTTLVSIAF
jgi:hypothetical protein